MTETVNKPSFSVVLLHEGMCDRARNSVTTSLTPIDIHDIARSCTTYGVETFFIAHPSPHLKKLARTLLEHWDSGFGSTYNPNRKEALESVSLVNSLDDAIARIDERHNKLPIVIATAARPGGIRTTFKDLKAKVSSSTDPFLLMLGTGWGMGPELLARGDIFLEPINGPTEFNHLSVRSACAIMLDRLFGCNCPGGLDPSFHF